MKVAMHSVLPNIMVQVSCVISSGRTEDLILSPNTELSSLQDVIAFRLTSKVAKDTLKVVLYSNFYFHSRNK